ncbi:mirror-image polydactyly gene 1 protein [Brachionichthys hirsutus]|uniref:mirror-image polydactyly gene 1 protein n=1 Tax=Brachionichthys hirsutus TaxID=412623 RepID=UPI0036049A55
MSAGRSADGREVQIPLQQVAPSLATPLSAVPPITSHSHRPANPWPPSDLTASPGVPAGFLPLHGGFRDHFVETPEAKYCCEACRLVLCQPRQTECGHRFCQSCIHDILSHLNPVCPADMEPLFKDKVRRKSPQDQSPQHLQEPPICSSPLTHRRSVSPVSPLSHRRSVSPVSLLTPRSLRGGGEVQMDLSTSREPSPQTEGRLHGSDGGGGSRGPGSPAFRRRLVGTLDSSQQEAAFGPAATSTRGQSFDRDKNISLLLKELDALRDVNKKLLDQLVQKEKELQKREVEEELREEQREAQDWERPAALLEEVLAAQKHRDQALMSRLLLANEERDEALIRSRQIQQALELENIPIEDSDLDVDELLQSISNADVQEMEQLGSVLVQHLRLARQRQNDITAQEMKAVMEERDSSAIKCKRLEQDLVQEREQRKAEETLLRLQKERGGTLESRVQLEAELQVLRTNHSSQKLLATPPSLPSDGVAPADQTTPLLVQLQQLSKEKQSMEAELQRSQEAEQDAGERVRRLERLVEVLRKKVGAGSLRAVI